MDMPFDTVLTAAIRIRFIGTASADTFHLLPRECARLNVEFRDFLLGSACCGGSFATEEAEHPMFVAFNFKTIAYIEPGKQY